MPNPITDILARHGLTRPDGRPLCTYLVTDTELDALLSSLRASPTPSAFVLVGAELWRRHYAGGAWEWSVITTPLGLDFIHRDLQYLTEQGLDFWGRDLLRLRRDEYLASIAREAGIPSPVLQAEGKRIRRFFKRLLEDLSLYGPTRASVLADLAAAALPERLRNPTFLDLATACALAARDLAALGTPLDELPDWRSRFPLRVDDDAALALVNNLVDTARVAPPRRPMRVITFLDAPYTAPALRRTLHLPAHLTNEELTALTLLEAGAMSPRMDLLAIDTAHPETAPRLLAHLVRGADHYRVELLSDRLFPEPQVELALRARGEVLARFQPPGATLSELPWIFAPDPIDDSTYRLVGQGAVRFLDGTHVLAALPTSCESQPPATPITTFGAQPRQRSLHRIEVDTRIVGPDYTLRIRPGAPSQSQDDAYTWHGSTLPLAPTAFRGLPHLEIQRPDGSTRRIPPSNLEFSSPALGRIRVRYNSAGEILFEDHLTILPADAELMLTPLPSAAGLPRDRVRVTFTSRESALLGTALPVLERTDSTLVIHPDSDRTPPATFDLELMWPDRELRVALRLPYPRPVVALIDLAHDSALPPHTRIVPAELHRYRAEAHASGKRPVFQVEARLEAKDITTPFMSLTHLSPARSQIHSLPLFAIARQIDRLFALSTSADALITLRFLDAKGGHSPQSTFKVARFSHELKIDRKHLAVEMPNSDAGTEVVALDISAPGDLIPLSRTTDGPWSLADLANRATSWLVMGRSDGQVITAPKLFAPSAEGQPLTGLREALNLPSFEQRTSAFEHQLTDMAERFDHPDWPHLEGFLDQPLPMSTFEVIRALVRVPAALVTLLLRSASPQVLVDRFEELPFLWATLPIEALRSALRVLRRHHDQLAANQPALAHLIVEDRDRRVTNIHRALTQRVSAFDVTFALIAHEDHGLVPQNLEIQNDARLTATHPLLLLSAISAPSAACLDGLRQRQADSHWPHHEAIDTLSARLPISADLPVDLPEHQRSVALAPWLAAGCMTSNTLPTPLEAFALRLCESFDPSYFEEAHRLAFATLLARSH